MNATARDADARITAGMNERMVTGDDERVLGEYLCKGVLNGENVAAALHLGRENRTRATDAEVWMAPFIGRVHRRKFRYSVDP